MDILFSIIYAFYFLLTTGLIFGWRKALSAQASAPATQRENFLSVVIPVRNEQNVVTSLIEDLRHQTYEAFEVIFVDDHSDDETHPLIKTMIDDEDHFSLIMSEGQGKKYALMSGIATAKGSIIVTTDADCRVGPEWLSSVNQYFQDDEIKFAFGAVRIIENESFFSKLQAIEFLSLIGSGAATHALGFPTMCNGANLAVRKNVLNEVGSYHDNLHIPSGDDEFMLRKIHEKYPDSIRFMKAEENVVSTRPQSDLNEFVDQRIRWAGKWRHNKNTFSKVLAFFILVFQLLFILTLPLAVAGFISPEACILLMAGKFFIESFFLQQVSRHLKTKWNWGVFILLQVLYPFYVVFIGIGSHFQAFVWKGRKTKSIHTKMDPIADND